MPAPKFEDIDIHYLDQWFSNLIDTMNYNIEKIETEVPTLDMVLTNLDSAPISYLRTSFETLIKKLNQGFEEIETRLSAVETKLEELEGK